MVVWEHTATPGTNCYIYGRFYDRDGQAIHDEFKISVRNDLMNQTNPQITNRPTNDQDFFVIWEECTTVLCDRKNIYGQIITKVSQDDTYYTNLTTDLQVIFPIFYTFYLCYCYCVS